MACRHHYVSLVVLRASLSAVFAIFLSVLFLRPTTVLAAGVVGTGTPESCTEAALDDALAGGGLVTFNCGMEPVTIALTAEKVITAETAKTTVDGAGLVTLSGGDAVRVFNVNEGAALEVQYLTVANGDGRTASGGGIYNEGTLTVTNSTLRDSSARYGGGIYNEGSLDVTNSTLSGNSGGGAGGIWNEGAANISNSTLTANTANRVGTFGGFGGGILNYSGTAQVINSTIAASPAS